MPYLFEMELSDGTREFVEVINTCKHHYTNESMRFVRIHRMVDGVAKMEYTFINENEWNRMLARRVIKE